MRCSHKDFSSGSTLSAWLSVWPLPILAKVLPFLTDASCSLYMFSMPAIAESSSVKRARKN